MKILNMTAIIAIVALFSASNPAVSADKTDKQAQDAVIKSKLLKIGLTVNEVQDSPIPGLKQVLTSRGVFYTSVDGQYFMAGRLFDVENGMQNLTDLALSDLRLEGVEKYKDSMIVFPAKEQKHVITVFTDTTCTYCKKMHAQMDEYNDLGITVQYLAFPRGGMASQGANQIQAVWCSADQQKAMTEAKAGQYIDAPNCNTKVAEHYNFGISAGVTGTPAIILEDGQFIGGYKPPSALLQDLQRVQ
ncbi:bifunctional protein-disulfide isomerase/oxidoreductase DsbC [Psychrosphaera ytuae]|uniref:Thiol:disulfide interchange protein n=1 Tax=Psychrosphaera ytuae TaxID=2820710 RepID=A0A975DGA2_9GAMM|nr:bifunctional protein-disulfide isomerase/oxidoreductase DsbC [Psychrosphaera ytuae]QTH65110.1 bifunctional protein-disulfide isomerase/oxidoreductase DsbC [Psychrosphaera ytuae]